MDYRAEPKTLIRFERQAEATGTRLTITETGIDARPEGRRQAACAANADGWSHQTGLLAKYLAVEN